jgi:hypothetical protein
MRPFDDFDLPHLFPISPPCSPIRSAPTAPEIKKREREVDIDESFEDEQPHKGATVSDCRSKLVYYVNGMVFMLMLFAEFFIEDQDGLRVVAMCKQTGERYFLATNRALFEKERALPLSWGRHRDLLMVLMRAGLVKEGNDKALLVPESALYLHMVERARLTDDIVMFAEPPKSTFHNMAGKRASVNAVASTLRGERKLVYLSRDLDKSGITFSRSKAIRLSLQEDPAAILALRAAKVVPRNTMRAMLVSEKNVYWVKE